ncbi:O-antigen ligase family protein [Butyrivibrio sp. INlla14]|uniref:O-antigen ligase family protein n=1 Tax=Butyrivibrio sp. INlla14 TaxID=1520808 RepID=UPI00087638D0|nr:hypothetical protein [Butyrivibrio sp. INlla14]SCY25747.1 hypothetical protein SAMN02910371_01615 [Butyrivibrio sp. INlla14]
MRKIISKKTGAKIVVMLLTLLVVLSIWPFRVWTDVKEYSAGGEYVGATEQNASFERSYLQNFITQYDRLSSIDVYISEMATGKYIMAQVLDENYTEVLRVVVDTDEYEIPGFVNIPMELNVEVGKNYSLVLKDCRSMYKIGLEDLNGEAGYVGSLFCSGQEIPARHFYAKYNYRVPMPKSFSMIAILIALVVAITAFTIIELFFKKYPEKNTISTVEKALRFIANPVAAVFFATLMIMVFPLKMFDSRAIDIIFYELGLIICAGIVFYGINHKVVTHKLGISFWDGIADKNKVVYVLQMLMIAMAIWYASEYMNGLYDIFHTLSQRCMEICLLLLILLTFSFKEVFNVFNLIWLVVSVIWSIGYYGQNKLPMSDKEYDIRNLALRYFIVIVILAGFVVIGVVRPLVHGMISNVRSKKPFFRTNYSLTVFGWFSLAFFVCLVVFRNTRTWGVFMVLIFGALFIRMLMWRGRLDWYKILSGGLMLNFAISLGFSLLHRYFAGYMLGRFGFIFHTVTVTAEYFTAMGAAATVMLAIKVISFPKNSSRIELFKTAWKEIVLFGWIMSYALFTVSRTTYVAIVACIFAVVIVVISFHKKQFGRILCTMILSVLVCFPAAFTMQRIIPTMIAEPVHYEIDDTDVQIRGGADWDNTNFMCVERFVKLFGHKILGLDWEGYNYPNDSDNYDKDGNPVLDIYGYPMQGAITLPEPVGGYLVSNGFTRAELLILTEELGGYVDMDNKLDVISGGRITIFKSYFKELNLTGHDVMGAELPTGEIAVHAHNVYLQVAYDNGIITGILFILLILGALIYGVVLYKKNINTNPLSLMVFAITIGFAAAGISEWVFHLCNPLTVALMLSFGGMIFKEKRYE